MQGFCLIRRVVTGAGFSWAAERGRGAAAGLPSATLSVPTPFLLLEEMYLAEDIIWTRK